MIDNGPGVSPRLPEATPERILRMGRLPSGFWVVDRLARNGDGREIREISGTFPERREAELFALMVANPRNSPPSAASSAPAASRWGSPSPPNRRRRGP
jgi:hypothetical protein